jgi:hypothetical protein
MSESHEIVGGISAEPLPAGRVGARLRVPLSGMPSRRWSRALSAHLAADLAGKGAVGHLHLDEVVEGSDLVLEGIEDPSAPALGAVLERAVEAANAACAVPEPPTPQNMPQERADDIARQVSDQTGVAPATGRAGGDPG